MNVAVVDRLYIHSRGKKTGQLLNVMSASTLIDRIIGNRKHPPARLIVAVTVTADDNQYSARQETLHWREVHPDGPLGLTPSCTVAIESQISMAMTMLDS